MKTTQKVIKIGSSYGVTLPKKQLELMGLKPGDIVEVRFTKVGEVDRDDVIDEYKKFIDKYGDALKSLADK